MKKIGKIIAVFIAVVLLLLVLVVGAFVIFKPDIVKAVYDGFMLDSEQIEEKKKENDKQLVNTIKDFGLNISEEDLQKLENGELSEEEMKELLLGGEQASEDKTVETIPSVDDKTEENTPVSSPNEKTDTQINDGQQDLAQEQPQNPKPENKPENKPETDLESESNKYQDEPPSNDEKGPEPVKTPDDKQEDITKEENKQDGDQQGLTAEKIKEYEEKTAQLVAKMYTLKSQYLGQIDGVVASMIAEYSKLPKEQRTTAAKTSIANKYLGTISSLEAQCDAQVNAIVSDLRDVLVKSGKDTSLADAVMSAYITEKETTKAAYINKYTG